MVVLKKLRGATLMETMVATVLIVIIFVVASLVMNSLMRAKSKGNQNAVEAYLKKLEYQYSNEKLQLPYYEDWKNWEISILGQNRGEVKFIAHNPFTKKDVVTSIFKGDEN